jgi:hypothetical protein
MTMTLLTKSNVGVRKNCGYAVAVAVLRYGQALERRTHRRSFYTSDICEHRKNIVQITSL